MTKESDVVNFSYEEIAGTNFKIQKNEYQYEGSDLRPEKDDAAPCDLVEKRNHGSFSVPRTATDCT